MKNTEKISAVVVTFNRKAFILETINGIFNQTKKVDHIFIVDNNSTDGTQELLKSALGNNKDVTLIFLSENTGSAGGFHEGAKRAYELGFDWVWFLDDDVCPEPNCLETLLKFQHISQCIHPSKVYLDGSEFIWEAVFSSSTGWINFINNISFKNGKEFTFVNIGCFEGMLLHRNLITKIGFPDKRFFIGGDDVIYGFEASLHTNVIFVRDAHIKKLIPVSKKQKPVAIYYSIRNQFLIIERLKKLGLFRGSRFYPFLFLNILISMTKHAFTTRSIKTPFYVMKAVFDGVSSNYFMIK